MQLLILFKFPALALRESALFMSSTLLMTELEAVKEGRFHPLERQPGTDGGQAY